MVYIRMIAICVLVLLLCSCEKKSAQQQGAAKSTDDAAATQMTEADTEKAVAEMTEAAKVLLDEATSYINDNKFDLAEKSLAKLDEMKGKLPESYHEKIDAANKMLQTAKATAGVKLPGQ